MSQSLSNAPVELPPQTSAPVEPYIVSNAAKAAPPQDNLKGWRLRVTPDLVMIVNARFLGALVITGLLYVFSTESNSQWMYLMSAGMIATLALSIILPILQVSDMRVKASLPPNARAGEKVAIKISLERIFGVGTFQILFPLRWLRMTVNVMRLGSLSQSPLSKPLLIPSMGEKETLQLLAGPLRRGIYRVHSITFSSCFPLGLVFWQKEIKFRFDNPDSAEVPPETVVYPKVYPVSGNFLQQLNVVTPSVGLLSRKSSFNQQTAIVRGVREYIRGDSPRIIHWASSARTGKLLSREFEAEGLPAFDLLIDSKWDWGTEEMYELALITAASLITLGHRWGLSPKLIVRNQVLVIEPPPMAPGLTASIEMLARLEPFKRTEEIAKVAARRGRRVDKLDDLIRKAKEGALIFLAPRTEKAQVEMVLVQPVGKTDADKWQTQQKTAEPEMQRHVEDKSQLASTIDMRNEPDDISRVGKQISIITGAEDIIKL
ncbi:MAG: DUF58 domain-containing protein [Candidatus Melainabacteria bacterium]|jgi:uncharacterized protein (DUF58 family)|nr:DUF58 domain-containing protein [Candidatus Melainabacteria bacterium]